MCVCVRVITVILCFALFDLTVQCGTRPSSYHLRRTRVVGGHDAKPGEFPWMVRTYCILNIYVVYFDQLLSAART